MRMRIRGTLFTGEITGNAGTIDHPLVELTMLDGSILFIEPSEITDKPPFYMFKNIIKWIIESI